MRGFLAALVLVAAGNSVRSQPDVAPPPVYPGPSPAPAPSPAPSSSWLTRDHSPGMCATYGTCGHRRDGDPLPCAANVPAAPPGEALATALQAVCPGLWADAGGPAGRYCCTADQVQRISSDTAKAMPFIVGCPACRRNFIQLWCVTTCSPDQATFANVTAVQTAFDTASTDAVSELEYWVSEQYSTQLYDSCKDVKFGAANVPAMSFIGGGATSGQAWLDFLGTLKDKRFPPIGSPIQIYFRPENATPPGLSSLVDRVVACGDNAFRCSCSDCPAAQGCAQPAPEPPPPPPACHVGSLGCLTFTLIWVYAATAACVLAGYALGGAGGGGGGGGTARAAGGHGATGAEAAGVDAEAEAEAEGGGRKERAARRAAPAGWEQDDFGDASGAGRLGQPLLARAAAAAAAGTGAGAGADAGATAGATAGGHRPPFMERLLQRGYYRLGLFAGTHPVAVAALGLGLVGLCCLGLLRFRVETDPQRLWVGPESQAAQERAAYEASFGPFYRVEQMILATQPSLPSPPPSALTSASPSASASAHHERAAANSSSSGGGAAPAAAAAAAPILADARRLELLFDMQQLVDELEAPLVHPDGSRGVVRLRDVCFKPFGDECATQSVLQYWRLNRTLYRTEQARPAGSPGRMTPEYCFSHWFTECRSAFQAPIDPHVVLGGFPVGDQFTTYTAGATSFVTTYPVSSEPQLRAAAAAWEAAFISLAAGRLSAMAAEAGLSLSFSTERSVQDELTRESRADAGTVAASYGIMLLYIAAALGSFPPPWSVWWAARGRGLQAAAVWLRRGALTSRAGLGLAGVAIVALSVAGALGLVSAAGLWCTLIIMEVIPFLVLAVGVDNMFVLAHAMAKQDHALPPAERLALALAAAGPSITLAAACETAAFALGGVLTSMPAVRNFSLAAAAAVALDFGLQVTVFAALLVLDVRRLQSRRPDCLPCLQLQPEQLQPGGRSAAAAARRRRRGGGGRGGGGGSPYRAAGTAMVMERHYGGTKDVLDEDELYEYAVAASSEYGNEEDRPPYIGPSSDGEVDEHSYWSLQRVLQAYFERVHAPLLSRPAAQAAVLLAFAASTCVCLALLPRLQVGLDQAVALPRDSYLQPYYRDVLAQLRVGPPLLLVVEGLDLDPAARQVEALCGVAGCAPDSLVNRVSAAARDPGRTYIAAAAASWLDDFMSWLSPDLPACCRSRSADALHSPVGSLTTTSTSSSSGQSPAASLFTLTAGGAAAATAAGGYCPPPDQPPCSTNASACAGCRTCVQAAFEGGRPSVPQFQAYLPWFLGAKPSEGCAKGGVGAYSSSLQRADPADPTSVAGLLGGAPQQEGGGKGGRVAASSFRTYYRPLSRQSDFIEAMRQSRAFAAAASRELGLRIYSYSLFHVFFEQYLGVAGDALRMVGLPLLAVVGVAWGLGGSLGGAALLAAVLGSLLLHLGGAMVLAGIQVNAVSLVNLAMALGIAVEFCAHVLHAYMVAVAPPPPPAPPEQQLELRPGWRRQQQQQQEGGQERQGQGQGHGQEAAGGSGVWSRLLARLRGGGGGGGGGYAPLPAAAADGPSAEVSGGSGGGGGTGGVWRLGCLGGQQRAARSRAALVSVGASVLSGVTLTKLVGVAVLAFARTQIFEIYYFRLYAALVVAGAAHGLVLLPVLLALAGPTAVF